MAKRFFLILNCILINLYVIPAFSQNDFYDINSVREIRISFKQHNWKQILDSLYQTGDGKTRLKGDVTVDGHKLYNAGIRYKGFSSCSPDYLKNPFSIYLDNCIINQNYEGYTSIKLSNVIHDPSFIREVLSYEIAAKYMPASKANFANIYVNDTLLGLYSNIESVDDGFTEEHFGSNSNSFFKGSPAQLEYPFGQNANLAYTHGNDSTGYEPYYEVESDYGWSDLFNLINILNNDTANLSSILNIDRTLWMHAFNYTVINLDSYIGYSQNYYMYRDDNGQFNPILWDMNMSFGSFRETDATMLNLSIPKVKQLNPLRILTASTYSPRPLIKNLLLNSTYKRMFLAHMRTIINENFKNNLYLTRAQEIQSVIDTYVLNDSNKFYSYDDFHNNLDSTTGTSADQYPGLKDLMEARMAYLDTFPGFAGAPVITDISHSPEYPDEVTNTYINAKVTGAGEVFLGYRFSTSGVFKRISMYDDGLHNDDTAGDSIYGASFLLSGKTVQYYVYAQNDSAGIFSPERAEYEYYSIQPRIAPGDIVINEIMAANKNTVADQDGEHDSWIELFNTTRESMNLKTLFMSDDPETPTKWSFPDTVIPGKSFMIIWADNDVSQSGLHSDFSLDENAGHLILYGENNSFIDSVTYTQQAEGKTYGRYPNGYGPFVYMLPTFGKYNYVGTTPLSGIILYPNPADNKIYIEFPSDENIRKIEIFNSDGQKVMSENFSGEKSSGPKIFSMNIYQLHDGLYFLKVVTDNDVFTEKFVVVKEKLY